MEVLHPRCAGLDVHKDSVVAAVRLAEPGGVRTEVRRFGTTTPDLLALADWLAESGWPSAAAPMPRWRRPGSTGSRSGTCCPTAISR